MLMTCFDSLLSITVTNKAFFIANKGNQLVYILYLYLKKSDSTMQKSLLNGRCTTFYLVNKNFANYHLWF